MATIEGAKAVGLGDCSWFIGSWQKSRFYSHRFEKANYVAYIYKTHENIVQT